MHLNLLLNSVVSLDRSPSPGSLAPLARKILLNATWKVKSLRVKIKSCKVVVHLTKFGRADQAMVDERSRAS